VNDFIQKLEKIELPNQLVAVLGDPLLQKLLLLKSSETIARRVDNWLLAFFEDQLQSIENGQRHILETLEAIRDYVRYIKVWI
jgi:centromere protein I